MTTLNPPMRMKEWVINEAERRGVTPKSIWHRIQRGYYRGAIKQKRINARVIFVIAEGEMPEVLTGRPTKTGLSNKKLGHASYVAAWSRMRKGKNL